MDKSKNFYQALLTVIDHFPKSGKKELLMCDKGKEMVGGYWSAIVDFANTNKAFYTILGDHIGVKDNDALSALRIECEEQIDFLEKQESDRNIDRKYKIKGILYGRISLIISILAFLFSLFSYCNRPELTQ